MPKDQNNYVHTPDTSSTDTHLTWEDQLNELYQEYFGRNVDESGLRTYSRSSWRGNVQKMRDELADSDEHRAFRETDVWKKREAKRDADERRRSLEYGKEYWTEQSKDSRTGGINVAGKGFDLSPHDNATRTWYMQERIDQGLGEEEYGTHQLQQIYDNVESRFLDEVYDSDGNIHEGVEAHWGLDLRRVGLGHTTAGGSDKSGLAAVFDIVRTGAGEGRDLDVLSDSYYETLTRGEVNWAAYQTDKAYQAAFKEMQERARNDDDPLTVAEDWDISRLGSESRQTERYVSLIRQVNRETNVIQEIMEKDGDGWKHNWEGRYDPDKVVADGKDLYVDGVKQTTAAELYGRDYNGINPDTGERWTPAERGRLLDPADYPMDVDEIKTKQIEVVKPHIPIDQVTVNRPKNIPPDWNVGEGKASLKIER